MFPSKIRIYYDDGKSEFSASFGAFCAALGDEFNVDQSKAINAILNVIDEYNVPMEARIAAEKARLATERQKQEEARQAAGG